MARVVLSGCKRGAAAMIVCAPSFYDCGIFVFVWAAEIHWPMYIELIIRWGIGTKHPSKPNQIKLVAFHI